MLYLEITLPPFNLNYFYNSLFIKLSLCVPFESNSFFSFHTALQNLPYTTSIILKIDLFCEKNSNCSYYY